MNSHILCPCSYLLMCEPFTIPIFDTYLANDSHELVVLPYEIPSINCLCAIYRIILPREKRLISGNEVQRKLGLSDNELLFYIQLEGQRVRYLGSTWPDGIRINRVVT